MTPHANATRIGVFAIGGLVLLAAAIISVFGARIFSQTERGVMFFKGSIFGLQVGAPAVFRGVRIGSVRAIGVLHDPLNDQFEIPVEVVIDRGLLREGQGAPSDIDLTLASLVTRGLTAQLVQQSLLTGQLYVDLDFRPKAKTEPPKPKLRRGLVEIPTIASTNWRTMQDQLTSLDIGKLVQDVSAITASVRQLVAGPQLRQLLDEMAQTAATLNRIGGDLERRIGPLANAAQGTLGDLRAATGRAGAAAERIGGAAERIAGAAGRIEATLAADSPLLGSVQKATDELGRSAVALQRAVADDSNAAQTMQGMQRTLADVSRAARAVRELAELLERQPDALIRGRTAAP